MAEKPTELSTLAETLSSSDFQVQLMTEVFEVNDDGRRSKSLGLLSDPTVAAAFVGKRSENPYKRAEEVVVITDGKSAYIVQNREALTVLEDDAESNRLRTEALGKLSSSERTLLGFPPGAD